MEKYAIENEWDLWFHSIKNNKWDKSSTTCYIGQLLDRYTRIS